MQASEELLLKLEKLMSEHSDSNNISAFIVGILEILEEKNIATQEESITKIIGLLENK